MAVAAEAQVVQTIDFPASAISGAWANGGCGTGNERGTSTNGAAMTMTWTDTTNAPDSSVVQIEVQANWKFWCSGGNYTVAINATPMGNGTPPNNQNNCVCNASPFATTSQVLGPGAFTWNPGAPNTLSFTQSGNSWIGVMDNSQNPNWSVRIIVTMLNQAPDNPTALNQIGGGQVIAVGGVTKSTTVTLRANVTDPDADDVFLQAECVLTNVFFTNTPNFQGTAAPSGSDATIDVTGLADGAYHWQVRAVDPFGMSTAWVSFGNNSEVAADFAVDTTVPPTKVFIAKEQPGDCAVSAGAAHGLLSPALLGFALIAFGFARRR
jgi:hypothetical protein